MRGAINYNEDKVSRGGAELIAASGFACNVEELGISQKLNRFNTLIGNSTKVSYNTVHLSLNFAPGENLDTETLQRIAWDYMSRIGFESQPFLVYRHDDTSHPHLHIVTTPILKNGRSINIHNLAKRKSEPARKEIEVVYGLVIAENRKNAQSLPLQPVLLDAARYGHSETKKAISNIVTEVVARYKFASLDELNAVLRQYNVFADRGAIGSRMYEKGGLVYSLIDLDGYKTGVPIKSSSIFSNPTLAQLRKKFRKNSTLKLAFQEKVQTKVWAVLEKCKSTTEFMEGLKRRSIGCSIQYHSDGTTQDISFVDHVSKSVFTSDDLGIRTEMLLERLNVAPVKETEVGKKGKKPAASTFKHKPVAQGNKTEFPDIFKILLTTESNLPELSPEFMKKRKKKRRR